MPGVGQRLMGAAARRTTEQFLSALDERIVSGAPAPRRRPRSRAPRSCPPQQAAPTGAKVIVASALGGFALALIGVAVGRWTARR